MIIQGNDPTVEPSFSLRNRLARTLWGLVWFFLIRPSPRPLHSWRAFWYRLFGAKLGNHVHIYPSAKVWAPWQLVVGDKVGIADGVTIYNMAPVLLGDHCVVSQGAHLCAGSHDIDSSNFQLITAPVVIDPYVWVCAEAFIGPGVHIERGCVVGARAVVMKSITPAWTVWAGNPATLKRTRSSKVEHHAT